MIYGYLRVSSDEQDVNSQKQGVVKFAELTGLRRNQVCRIEQGYYSVGVDILAVLADALGKRIVLEDK